MPGKSIPAKINPMLLVWARSSAGLGLEDAAKKLRVSEERLVSWEKGEASPTVKQVMKIAEKYKRPFAAFYLEEPPQPIRTPHDYRVVSGARRPSVSHELALEIRRAHFRREMALELAEQLEEPLPAFKFRRRPNETAEVLASRAREFFGITMEVQHGWKDEWAALREWRRCLENHGILVFQASSDTDLMRGFSVATGAAPVIVVSSKDSPNGRIFTLFHEVGHLMMGEDGVCNPTYGRQSNRAAESFCNRFSAAFLAPRDVLMRDAKAMEKENSGSWSQEDVNGLARKYSVSTEMLAIRLSEFDVLSRSQLDDILNVLLRRRKTKRSGPVPQDRKCLSQNGATLVRLALSAYNANTITASELSSILKIKQKWVPSLEEKLLARA